MMRTIITLIITFVGIIASFRSAFYGLLAYAFWSYTYPEKFTWGLLPLGKLSFIMGLVVVITTVVQKKRLFSNDTKLILIALFWFFCLLGVFTAGSTETSNWQFQYFTRVIAITFMLTVLIDDLKKFKYYLWAMAIFVGLISAISGLKGTLLGYIGGADIGYGGPIGDRNFMAVILCVVIPVVFYLGNIESNKRLKLLLRFTLFGDILALVLTYARAGFLGLVAVVFFVLIKVKHKLLIGVIASFAIFIIFTSVLPRQYIERLFTMRNIDLRSENVDNSLAARLMIWGSAVELIKVHPLQGVGFYNADIYVPVFIRVDIGFVPKEKAIHNSLLQVGAELGLPALFLYILIFLGSFRTLGNIRRRVVIYSLRHEIEHFALMLQAAFVGFFVSAFFVNAAYLDISWHLVGLTIVLGKIVKKEIEEKETNEVSINVTQ